MVDMNIIGKIDFFGNPKDAMEKINQVDSVFQKTQNQIDNVFTAFKDKDSYGSEYQYNKAMALLNSDEDNKDIYIWKIQVNHLMSDLGQDGRMIYSLVDKSRD